MERAFYLWIKSPCGAVDVEVKVISGGSINIVWPSSYEGEDEESCDDFRARAGIPDSSPSDQRRYVVDSVGWRCFDARKDTWNPDGYDSDEDDLEREEDYE